MSDTHHNINTEKVIAFELNDEEYAIPVQRVSGIEWILPITRVPSTRPFIKGVVNLRGVVIPIVDLRLRFNIDEVDYDDSTRIIIVYYKEMEIGIIVDEAKDVIDINPGQIEPPPEVIGTVDVDYINGVIKLENRLLVLLDLDKTLDYNILDYSLEDV